jgi:glyoxylase-like metal-dependent hydrolase (beta-lactamase superfamily II)
MDLKRRTVVKGLGASLLLMPGARAFATTRIGMGEIEVFSVSDGNLMLPASFFFDGLPQAELMPILEQYGVTGEQLEPPCNVTVLKSADRVVLFDAGSGSGFMPTAGRLLDSLDAVGLAAEDVTDVVFTHAHPDHIWGVLDDFDDLVFPEATFRIGQDEWDYWSDPNTVNTIGEARASFAVGAQRRLEAIEQQVTFFGHDEEILPGVSAVATYGHTPGHMSFEIRSGTDALFVGGDAIGNHHVAFARPDWPSGADQDKTQGAATRTKLLDKLATEQMPLLGFHLPNGGLGRVEKTDDAYTFVPEVG